MSGLEFIKEKELRETLENSIEYIYALFEQSKIKGGKELYKEETYRVIVLYVISTIEAVLLYFYKEQSEKIEHIEYKFVEHLSPNYVHTKKKNLPVIIAVQEKIEKKEVQIGLQELVNFFKNKKLIKERTATDILDLNEIRNTFHFCKPRIKNCDIKLVESALKLLVHMIETVPNTLKVGFLANV